MSLVNHARFLALSLLLTATLAQAEPQTIKIQIYGVQPASGTLEISVFDSAENFMKLAYLQQSVLVSEENPNTAQFNNVPEGEYAIVVVHDANDNGALDRGFLGIGGENYGFSNDAMHWFGWPDFDDASFTAEGPETEIEINMN